MDGTLVVALIGASEAIAVAVIAGLFARDAKKRKAHTDEQAAQHALRAEENRLAMKLMSADMSLTMATAAAVRDGHTNGEMTAAFARAEKAELEYFDFINTTASKQLAK